MIKAKMTSSEKLKSNILFRLSSGEVILGDGGYTMTMEKRGYVKAGDWTSEVVCEHPEAVEQLAYEFARAGADVTQTFTFWVTDDNEKQAKARSGGSGRAFPCRDINQAACDIATKVARDRGTIIVGGVTQTAAYTHNKNKYSGISYGPDAPDHPDKAAVQKEIRNALEVFTRNDVDLILCEYFRSVEEMEWALEVALSLGKPVGATMCIGPNGDEAGVCIEECAIRMARAGADLVGLNCIFDPFISLEGLGRMKVALDSFNLKPHLMVQPLGYKTPDAGHYGWVDIPEFPYAVEPRQITRFEAARFAREAYELGVRYIGGCCGFEPYHIRAMAEELSQERGRMPESSKYSDHNFEIMAKLSQNRERYKDKGDKNFWMNLDPATGRPRSLPFCRVPDPQIIHNSALQ